MNPRRVLRCLALTVPTLLFLFGGGFAGCGSDDSTPVQGALDAGRDATSDVTTDSGGCPAGQTACGARCVDLQSDSNNCNTCGVVCGSGTDCEQGACLAPCLAGQTRCSGRCIALETDNVNCGSCGHTCSTGLVCSNGTCDVACAPPLTTCGTGDADAGSDAGASLDSGTDAATDAGGASDASADGGDAGDTATDAAVASDAGPVVSTATRYCARTASDENNCGACGVTCGAGKQCDDGVCSDTCAIGQTVCTGVCRDLATDLANCGACGTACPSGQVCSGGVCQASCGIPFTLCGAACANTASDPTHCGSCATSCAPENVKAPACSSGTCNYVGCQSGFSDCDGNPVNGCELATASDVTNCGGCGVHCAGANVVATTCSGGTCGYSACKAGFADCDGNPANGCEADLGSVNSCGACGNVCPTGSACSGDDQCVPGNSYFLPDFGLTATVPNAIPFVIATAYPSTIYYTTDGSAPSLEGTAYPSPVTLPALPAASGTTTTFKWIVSAGGLPSPVQTRTITRNDALRTTSPYVYNLADNIRMTTAAPPVNGDSPANPAIVVAPGATINGLVDLELVDNGCPNCNLVSVIGINEPDICPYAPLGDDEGAYPGHGMDGNPFVLTAPTRPGVYFVQLAVGELDTCAQAMTSFAASFAAGTGARIAVVEVR